ncbi:pyridoxal phosphate-dependent aminotransferase [Erysipelotrichaceae bacterium OttesenSCG-928-M19]|nr:pyridoxal phosphate-dependent aminotransferase [Erysipelotrichaceae bacterium OttesenSCG-928-M19]
MEYNFDELIDRKGTHTLKQDVLPEGAPADTLSLWIADMDFSCPQPVIDALHQRVDQRIFGYTKYDNDELKDAVYSWFKRRHNWEIVKDTMFFAPGIVPALAFLINMLTKAGEGIIIQKPVYYPFMAKIEANDRIVVNNALIYENNTYVMDYDDLENKLAQPNNKGIILSNPHNPVGRVWSELELKKLVELAKKYDKWIISDEIHCDLTREGISYNALLKIAPEYKDRIIACTAPSKTFNLAGMQFSNIIIPNKNYQELWTNEIADKFSVNLCSPLGLTAIIAAYNDGEEWLDQLRLYLDSNIKFVEEYVKEYLPKANFIKCEGTYLVWLDFREYCNDKDRLEHAMLQVAKVSLDEGYIFGDEGIGFERINIASPRSVIEDCMKRIKKGIESI